MATNQHTRRRFVGAMAALPIAILAAPALAQPEPREPRISPLEGFAQTWLHRFTEMGGGVQIDAAGRLGFWLPEYHVSPHYERDRAIVEQIALPARQFEANMEWRGAFFDGKIRELHSLAEAVPGGMDAIRSVIRRQPSLGYPATSGGEG